MTEIPPPEADRRGWKLAAVGAGLVVAVASIAASLGIDGNLLLLVQSIPGADTTGHFVLLGAVALLATLAFVGPERHRQAGQVLRVIVVLAVLISIDEFLQLAFPRRTFSFSDLFANYAGILVFSLTGWWLRRSP